MRRQVCRFFLKHRFNVKPTTEELEEIMKKTMGAVLLAAALLIAGCWGGDAGKTNLKHDSTAEKGLEILGANVQFDPNVLMNNGEPIEVEFWVWDAEEIFRGIADSFSEIYPNVSIKVVSQPWQDYWTKLPLALQNGTGPAMFCIHNSQHENLVNYLQPYDIALEDLKADFSGVEGHVIDGQVYYIDYGMMSGSIFYNKDMWAAAGLNDSDIPKTWDEFASVAQKLTRYDDDGRLIQAGFNYNKDVKSIIIGLNYQKGQMMFDEDLQTLAMDNSITAENFQFLIDLYEEQGVGSKDFGISDGESFGQGQSAMVYKWGWYYNQMLSNYPDVQFGVFAVPTPSRDVPVAYDRYNGESTLGISGTADEASQEVAQAFVRYFMSNDEAMKELCLRYSIFPAKKTLVNDEDVKAHPVMKALAPNVERLVWPGPFPGVIETQMQQIFEDVVFNEMSVEEALEKGNALIVEDMQGSDFVTTERQYKYAKEMNTTR